jgi:hypothetical protein
MKVRDGTVGGAFRAEHPRSRAWDTERGADGMHEMRMVEAI